MRAILLVVLTVGACRASTAPSGPTEPVPTTTTPSETGSSCLMVNICGCNLGCAAVPLSKSQLRAGARVRVTKGTFDGKDLKVIETVDAAGDRVFALSDREENHPCSLSVDRGALAYVCETTKSGPVPAKACASGCD